jgi:two-component system, NtrC family, response regulator AtoC
MPDQTFRILIVDDEPNMLHMLSAVLREDGFETSCAASAVEALQLARDNYYDFILSDVRMPGMNGLELLDRLRAKNVESMVILMSAYGNVDLALKAIRNGAYDYISKPFKTDEVTLTFRKAAERERLRKEVLRLRRRLTNYEMTGEFVAGSPQMTEISKTIAQVARFDLPVFITGESGAGKELVAREIHRLSARKTGGFVAVNCAAIPENLLESELFGFKRGAFTGAVEDKPGLFEEADEGTLLLDEIGSMGQSLQSKLLGALDRGEIRRLGETKTIRVSVRIIASTNEDVSYLVRSGRFREDLYYRLHVMPIHVPPLRERPDDILPLVEYFISFFNKRLGLKVKGISRGVKNSLLKWRWRGNVRELQNVIERAMILAESDTITVENLPPDLVITDDTGAERRPPELSLKKAYKETERRLIGEALDRCEGNRSRAATLLEISYPSLLQKIKDLGIG